VTNIPADTALPATGDVVAVPYVGASGRTLNRGTQVDDNTGLSAADLLECNRDLQGSRAIRLLAATNLSLYATLINATCPTAPSPRPSSSCASNATSTTSTTPSPGWR
jgi:hypothetical protein